MTHMRKMEAVVHMGFTAVFLVTVSAVDAFAYIDPGMGSYILQMLAVAFAGVAVGIKTFWYQIKSIFSRKPAIPLDDSETDDDASNNQ